MDTQFHSLRGDLLSGIQVITQYKIAVTRDMRQAEGFNLAKFGEVVGIYEDGQSVVPRRIPLMEKPGEYTCEISKGAYANQLGVLIKYRSGEIETAKVTIEELIQLKQRDDVVYIAASYRNHLLLDASLEEIGATQLHNERPFIKGEEVIVGIVDTGIDYLHKDFRVDENPFDGIDEESSRILYIWDQTDDTIYTKEQIEHDIALGLGPDEGYVHERDDNGHGTHVAGIAAGDSSSSDVGYIGMAPEADITVVKFIWPPDDKIVDGVDFVFDKADKLAKPAVVNLSLGHHIGPHDGTSNYCQALDQLAGPGKIIVAAAGNEGDDSIHAGEYLNPGEIARVDLEVTSGTSKYILLDFWYPGDSEFWVAIDSPNYWDYVELVASGGEPASCDSTDGLVYVDNASQGINDGNGMQELEIFFQGTSLGASYDIAPGTWTICLYAPEGTAGGRFDGWVALTPDNIPVDFISLNANTDMTVGLPAVAEDIIAVGAYTTKNWWIDVNDFLQNLGVIYGAPFPLHDIAFFSSKGPTRDGRQKPEISAPGAGINSSLSQNSSPDSYWRVLDGVHRIEVGTSQACPHVAGEVALMLQGQPSFTPLQIREKLQNTARQDFHTGSVPNFVWGHGKLDAYYAFIDVTTPQVEITSPASGDVVAKTIDITASATDDTGITQVEFWDTSLISSDTVSPYAVSWDTVARVSDGTCTLKTVAYDTQGLSATDATLVVVDNTPPEALIVSPASGETVSGTIDIEGTAWDVNFKEYILEYGEGTSPISWSTITTSTTPISNDTLVRWNTTSVDDGTYSLRLTCEDEANNTSQDKVLVAIDNTAPVVDITSPASGDILLGVVDLEAAASDNTGITRVEFWYDSNFIASDDSNIYAVSWDTTGIFDGTYTLTAKAFDEGGNIASDSISITVNNTNPQIFVSVYTSYSDIIYKNNETITLVIELKQPAESLSADFSRIDSNGPMVEASLLDDSQYTVSHTISTGNTRSDGFYVIPVTALIFQSFLTEESFVTVLDNSNLVESATESSIKGAQEDVFVAGPSGSSISLILSTSDDTTVTIFKYQDNPHPEATFPATALPKYADISISDPEAVNWPVKVEVTYTDEEVASLGLAEETLSLFYWKEGEWGECSSTGVDTLNNIIWANMLQEELTGSPLAPGGNVSPLVEITSPESGDLVAGTIDLIASATDDTAIVRVEFWDTSLISSDTVSPYAVSWDTAARVSDGTCTLKAVAYDTQGLSATDTILIMVDNTDPETLITYPASGETVSGTIDIEGTTWDTNFKEYTLEYGEGTSPVSWQTITTSTTAVSNDTLTSWNTAGVNDGTYTIKLTCEDEANNTSEDRVVVTVDNAAPQVDITSPESGDLVAGIIDITASVTDDTGIARVEFYHDDTFIASDSTNSYAVSWDTTEVSDGPCTLKAVAYDTQGLSSSDVISVTVDNTDPEALITYPASGETVSGTIDIEGTTWDTNFKEYTLEYDEETSPISWIEIITSTVPVNQGILANWDTTGLKEGVYLLRLKVRDEVDNEGEDTVRVTVEEGPEKFIVYPNPCRVGWLKFANLPQGARVYIYTISGEPVRVLSEDSGVAEWDLRNRQGSRVFAGIYIYRVDKTGKVGKFAIIR